MILSRKLLQRYIPELKQISNEQFVKHVISMGLEVEQCVEITQNDYLIIGQIIDIKQHTYSQDKVICTIKINTKEEKNDKLTIIYKKENINKNFINKYVIVALKGSEICGNIIAEKDVKGIISEGIICTYNQLIKTKHATKTFFDKTNEIIILDSGKIGDINVNKYVAMDDYLLEVTIPHNRNELHGIKYIAQELSAKLGLRLTGCKGNATKTKKYHKNVKTFTIIDQTKNENNAFSCITINCNENNSSPWFLKGILLNNHIQPTNLIEDIGKLVTIFTGVPLFLFDLSKINGNIFLKKAENETTITDESGKNYKVARGDLTLVDGNNKIICLAGVCVDKNVMIGKNSKKILIIVGNYDKDLVFNTVNRLKISGNLVAKGVSHIQCNDAVIELKRLMNEFTNSNNKISIGSITNKNLKYKKYGNKVKIDYKLIANFLGLKISEKKIKKNLSDLKFNTRSHWVFPPAYRTDIHCWQDVAEEVLKMNGIDQIPKKSIKNHFFLQNETDKYDKIYKIISMLTDLQITNVVTKNLCTYEEATNFNHFDYHSPLKLKINSSYSYLRFSLTNNLLKILEANNNLKINLTPIFEIQKIHSNINENYHLGILLPETIFPISWKQQEQLKNDIFLAKGITKKIISMFGFDCEFKKIKNKWMSDDNSLEVFIYDNLIGYVGLISKKWLSKYNLDIPIYCIELRIEELLNSFNTDINDHSEITISNQQKIFRDITLSLEKNDEKRNFSFLKSVVDKIDEIQTWELISVFDETNCSSYTIHCELNQNFLYEKTSNDINLVINTIFAKLISKGFKIK